MRYSKQNIFANEETAYKRYLKPRGLSLINQYDTPKFKFPKQEDLLNFSSIKHIWSMGDRYFKLAGEYYSDPELWWVIAFYNKKPTEFHVNVGEVLYIPVPLETVLFYMGY
jgi:nucleoid-associated protein YgaU